MDNEKIAAAFDELADLLEFKGENVFRVRAYRTGAKAIRDLDEPVVDILSDAERDLASLPGIGKTLAEKSQRLAETGTLEQLERLRVEIPYSVMAMLKIPGVGAKKASQLHKELGIQSLEQLRSACESGAVQKLKGFGVKTEKLILAGLSIAQTASERMRWADADLWVQRLSEHMKKSTALVQMEFAGSYRRGRDTVGDLDILCVASDRDALMNHFESFADRSETLLRGDEKKTKMSIRVGSGLQVDLRIVEADQFGAALQYFTGSQAHNVHVRSIAKRLDLKVNEYGVFREGNDTSVAGADEQEVYAILGLPWFPQEIREDRFEFDWAARPEGLSQLVQLSDIQGDLHMHTTATDGQATLREMADAALERGLKYIAITDHSQRVSMASGLNPERLRMQWEEIDRIRPEYEGRLQILKGIECDILERGGMDLPDDCLAEADWVLASIHYGQKQPRAQITERILGAIENAFVSCIAHPTGRLINQRPAYDVDMEAVMQAASKHRKMLELNANPARLDLHDVHCLAARRHGIPIVINTDAHSTYGLDVMRFGILQARRGGLAKADVANTFSWDEVDSMIGLQSPKS